MNEHKNGITKQYRYKKFNEKTQKYIGKHFFPQHFGFYYNQTTNGVKYVFIKHDYKPYFLFRLFWFFKSLKYQKPNSKLTPQRKKHITVVSLMVIAIIVSIIIGWDNIISFFNTNF